MTTKDEALKMALDALETVENSDDGNLFLSTVRSAADACREALAHKDEQEPVAWVDVKDTHQGPYDFHGIDYMSEGKHLLYTTPPKRQPLTDEQIREIADSGTYVLTVFADGTKGVALDRVTVCEFARAIEAAHGIGSEHERR